MNNLKDCGKEYPLDLEREAYTTETGAEVFHIKANLPTSQEGDKQGNGEGVFVLIDEETKKAYNNDQAGGLYTAILDNDSIEWPELKPGTRIPLTLRGTFRPVVPFSWLENYRTACGAWRRHEQAAHGYPEDYPDSRNFSQCLTVLQRSSSQASGYLWQLNHPCFLHPGIYSPFRQYPTVVMKSGFTHTALSAVVYMNLRS